GCAVAAAGGLGGARRGRRAGHGEAPRAPLRRGTRADRRPRGGAGDRDSTNAGTGALPTLSRSPGEVADRLAQVAAHQYNPFGTSPEDPSTVGQAIDGNTATVWQTSTYNTGQLGQSGVGFYVDAYPSVAANLAVLQTPSPGFGVQIWGTDRVRGYNYSALPRPGISPATLGWTRLGN